MTKSEIKDAITELLEEGLDKEFIKAVFKFIRLEKILDCDQLLIEKNDSDKFIIGNNVETYITDLSYQYQEFDGDNENDIKLCCEIAKVVINFFNLDDSDHNQYRFFCGLEPNTGQARKDFLKEIDTIAMRAGEGDYTDSPGEILLRELCKAGYEIVKKASDF